MQQIEKKEQEMLERLKTTFGEMQQTESKILDLQKGNAKTQKGSDLKDIDRKIKCKFDNH